MSEAASPPSPRHGWLLGAIVLLLFESSMRGVLGLDRLGFSVVMTAVLVGGIYSSGGRGRMLVIGMGLAVPTVLLQWIAAYGTSSALDVANLVSASLLILYTVIAMVAQIFRTERISIDTILGGITVYLLLGILFLLIFSLIELVEPGSYASPGASARPDLLYFSFVTLTTLGYGDVYPLSDVARTFAFTEAVVGQLYLTVLIAWLVGVHISQSRAPR